MNVTGLPLLKNAYSKGFYLEQNNSNPFDRQTSIRLNLPCKVKVTVLVTNSFGRVVDKIIANIYEAGSYNLEFLGDGLPKGTYFYHVVADKFSDSIEMELIK